MLPKNVYKIKPPGQSFIGRPITSLVVYYFYFQL